MKTLTIIIVILLSINVFSASSDESFDEGVDLLGISIDYIKTIEPIVPGEEANGPLFEAYLCVYTETFTKVMMSHVNDMMKNIFKEVRDESGFGNLIFKLIEKDDPDFFDNLLEDETTLSVMKQCESKITLAKKQSYVNEIIIKKVISLATVTGLSLGKGMSN